MPFMTNGHRDYKRELQWEHKKSPNRVRDRSARNKARAIMVKKVGKTALKGKDVGHKTAISKGGLSQMYNLMVQDAHSNRSFSRNRNGSMKSETSRREKKR